MFEAFDVADGETGERIGIESVYHQWWKDDAGERVGREILLRVQDAGQEYPLLMTLSGLAESTESVRIGDRDVSSLTRVMIDPMVRHATPRSWQVALLEVRTVSQAAMASKSRV